MKTTYSAVAVFFLTILLFSSNSYTLSSKTDILFVLDNSGSMKKNDPDFLTRKAAVNFIEGLNKDSRVGFVIFADKADLTMPLTPVVNPDLEKNVANTMGKLFYSGKYTNIPTAIERAIYDLKQNGRKDAEKLIIFMTDGFIDTGDAKKDGERGKWLKEELTLEARNAGIRIFSVAFTEEADFELIQTLAVKTEGGYYRAIKKEDLQNVFSNIQQAILTPRTKAEPKAVKEGFSKGLLVVAVVGLIVLGIVVITVISKGRKREIHDINPEPVGVADEKQPALPDAILEDMESITGKKEIRLSKREMTIGRAVDTGKPAVDIAVPQNTMSALHATIEYRDNSFFVIDRRSTNKTYLNNQVLSSDVAQRLKSGDIITFDKYKFRFIIKEQIGKSGTVLRPAAAGGTIIRPQGSPPEPKPLPPAPAPEAGLSQHAQAENDEEGTRVKPNVCEIHPSYKATEFCPVCKKGYCTECMVEKDGKKICRTCAA